jgi:hypothetical protein
LALAASTTAQTTVSSGPKAWITKVESIHEIAAEPCAVCSGFGCHRPV